MLSEKEQSLVFLIAEEVKKHVSEKPVFNALNFSLSKGDCCLVKGKNGSGKTTLMRLISGVYLPDAGTVKFQDSGLSVRQSAGRVNLVESSSFLYPYLTIEENFNLFSKISGREVGCWQEMAEQFGLLPWLKTILRECSAGTIRKASLVRAISSSAEVLALDEPFNYLDSASREMLAELISEQAAIGRTLIVSTNLPEIPGLKASKQWMVKNCSLESVVTT